MANHVVEELEAAPTTDARVGILNASQLLGAGFRVHDSRGALLGQSSFAEASPRAEPLSVQQAAPVRPYPWIGVLAPGLHNATGSRGTFGVARGPDGSRWRVYVVPMRGGNELLTALLPLRHIDATISQFGRLMLLMAIIGGLVTFVRWARKTWARSRRCRDDARWADGACASGPRSRTRRCCRRR